MPPPTGPGCFETVVAVGLLADAAARDAHRDSIGVGRGAGTGAGAGTSVGAGDASGEVFDSLMVARALVTPPSSALLPSYRLFGSVTSMQVGSGCAGCVKAGRGGPGGKTAVGWQVGTPFDGVEAGEGK